MTKYIVELEGTVQIEAEDEIHAEDLAMDFIHGDVQTIMEVGDVDINFNVTDVKEV